MTKEQEKVASEFIALLNALKTGDERVELMDELSDKVSKSFCRSCGRRFFPEEGDVSCNCWRDK